MPFHIAADIKGRRWRITRALSKHVLNTTSNHFWPSHTLIFERCLSWAAVGRCAHPIMTANPKGDLKSPFRRLVLLRLYEYVRRLLNLGVSCRRAWGSCS